MRDVARGARGAHRRVSHGASCRAPITRAAGVPVGRGGGAGGRPPLLVRPSPSAYLSRVRTLLALALGLLAACSRSDRVPAPSDAPSTARRARGPDLLVLRFPQAGGAAKAYAYPRLDSVIWTSSDKVPALDRVLAFDANAGSVATVDAKGALVRVDLRLGTTARQATPKLIRYASADGWAVYGLAADGSVARLTPAGDPWLFKPPFAAREALPQPDLSLLVLADRAARTTIWRIQPTDPKITDTVTVPHVTRAIGTPTGDRIYVTGDSGVIGVRSRNLQRVPALRLDRPAHSVVTTPSGDRIYIVGEGSRDLTVVDRYTGRQESRIALPGVATELRMDAQGRYVLARPATGDSIWVIAVGTDRVLGTTPAAWRRDLPTVAPDGVILLPRGRDVVGIDGETLKQRFTVAGGAADTWLLVTWNGFRPRSKELDDPVTFRSDSVAPDSAAAANNPFAGQSPARDSAAADSAARTVASPPPPVRDTAKPQAGFTVQYAALRDEATAKTMAPAIRSDATSARVLATVRDGVTIYRVIMGPFPSHADAERAAKKTGRSYWIYEGAP